MWSPLGGSLKPKAAGLCDDVLAMVSQHEAKGETEVWYQSRMVRVTEGEQSSASEIQFRATVHEAPTRPGLTIGLGGLKPGAPDFLAILGAPKFETKLQ